MVHPLDCCNGPSELQRSTPWRPRSQTETDPNVTARHLFGMFGYGFVNMALLDMGFVNIGVVNIGFVNIGFEKHGLLLSHYGWPLKSNACPLPGSWINQVPGKGRAGQGSLCPGLRGLGYGPCTYRARRISRSTPHADSACRLSNDTPLTHSMRKVAHPLRSELDRRV